MDDKERLAWIDAVDRTICAIYHPLWKRITLQVQTERQCSHERCDAALDILDRMQMNGDLYSWGNTLRFLQGRPPLMRAG